MGKFRGILLSTFMLATHRIVIFAVGKDERVTQKPSGRKRFSF